MSKIEIARLLVENGGKPILCKTEYGNAIVSGVDFAEDTENPFIHVTGTDSKKAEPVKILGGGE